MLGLRGIPGRGVVWLALCDVTGCGHGVDVQDSGAFCFPFSLLEIGEGLLLDIWSSSWSELKLTYEQQGNKEQTV